MNSSGGLEIVFEKLRFCDGEYAYRRSKAVFSNFSDVAWTLPERNQEDEGLVRCASLQFFVRHYSHCGPNNWTSVIKLHPFLKARFVTEENTFNHVFPIHDLVLFSWTGTQKCIKRPKKKKKQLSNDRPPRKQTILNLYPFVYQYKFTLVLTAWSNYDHVHFLWHVFSLDNLMYPSYCWISFSFICYTANQNCTMTTAVAAVLVQLKAGLLTLGRARKGKSS